MTKLKKYIYDKLESEYRGYPIWKENCVQIQEICLNIPDIYNNENSTDAIAFLYRLKDFLQEYKFDEKGFKFIDEEIQYLQDNYIISKHIEKDEYLSDDTLNKFVKINIETEGIIGIKANYNIEQLRKISKLVYNKTKLLKFYISREVEVKGKITAELNEKAQNLPVIMLLQNRKRNSETGEYDEELKFFNEFWDKKRFDLMKEIKAPFYIYNFIYENDKEYIIYSTKKLLIGDYTLFGVAIENDDYKLVSESFKIKTKIPQLFVQEAIPKKIVFDSHEQFSNYLKKLEISHKTFYNFPFTILKNNKNYLLQYQDWFKNLLWAWLLHSNKGDFNPYPAHIFISGKPGTGKSWVLNCLHSRSGESKPIYSGSSSTMKNLIPSFAYKPAKPGYLAECSRFAFVDEFLRCLPSVRNNSKGEVHDESVGMMNDLLEHQKREAGSGISKVSINMTARVLSTTNPVKGTFTMNDLLNILDNSFMSRWLVYIQTEDDVVYLNKYKNKPMQEFNYNYDSNDMLSIIDYLQSFDAVYDWDKVENIFNDKKVIMSEKILQYYETRYIHHIQCIIDGIIKTRCLMENDMTFTANEKDYEVLNEIWTNIIRSWINPKEILKLPIEKRIYYMPSNAQYLYSVFANQKKVLGRGDLKELTSSAMHHLEMYSALIILVNNEIIHDMGEDKFKPYWLGRNEK